TGNLRDRFRSPHVAGRGYGFAGLASAVAAARTALTLVVRGQRRARALRASMPLSGWYGGEGLAGLAVVLAILVDSVIPRTLALHDPWSLTILAPWCAIVAIIGAYVGACRRRSEELQRRAFDRVEQEVERRTRELRRRERYFNVAESLSHSGCFIFAIEGQPIFW